MAYTIEKGVPAPSGHRKRYPWRQMEPGDSFLVPCKPGDDAVRTQKAIATAGWQYCRTHRPELMCRSRIVEGGVRVWLLYR